MTLVSPTQASGLAEASDVNTPVNELAAVINGNIDNDNVKAGAGIDGSKLADDSIPHVKLEDTWWEELGRTTLDSAGDTISVASLPARKYLMVIASLINSGSIRDTITFNNDTTATYAIRRSANGAADSTAVSANNIDVAGGANTVPHYIWLSVVNITAQEKVGRLVYMGNPSGAANAAERIEGVAKWANTAAQISRVDLVNTSTGDYAIGSEVVVLGHN